MPSYQERELFKSVKRELGTGIDVELLDSVTLKHGVIVIVYKTTSVFDGKEYTTIRAKMSSPNSGAAGIILDSGTEVTLS
jgi:hypothetical protein